ncbi:hypothetical protein [Paenibacillus naphthalenovorans]|uniref:hypothetical protein n=1 Tax=Paenibacillus naphthalenovorans TaxID=162209 RepID=UPI003D2D6F21
MGNDKAPLIATDPYKAGWRADYYYGRLAQMNGEKYDDRTLTELWGSVGFN